VKSKCKKCFDENIRSAGIFRNIKTVSGKFVFGKPGNGQLSLSWLNVENAPVNINKWASGCKPNGTLFVRRLKVSARSETFWEEDKD
jgi:hypothetical protein